MAKPLLDHSLIMQGPLSAFIEQKNPEQPVLFSGILPRAAGIFYIYPVSHGFQTKEKS